MLMSLTPPTTLNLNVLVFKTKLAANDMTGISHLLNHKSDIIKWTVDLEDTDKVLRIETFQIEAKEIIQLLTAENHFCEELT